MGYGTNTTYLRCRDLERIAFAFDRLFDAEGRARIPRPPPRNPARYDPMQYGNAEENDIWAVALFAGAPGWTVVKTAPLELLAERAGGADRMRLADVAEALRCDALQLNVYDGDSAVLVEADSRGNIAISGLYGFAEDDPLLFHDETIDPAHAEAELRLIDPGVKIVAGEYVVDLAAKLERALGGPNAASCDNLLCFERLVPHVGLDDPDALDLYYERAASGRE